MEINNYEGDICAETAFSLILGRNDLRGTGAHHQKDDAIRAAETARMHPRAHMLVVFGCHSRLSGILSRILKKDAGQVYPPPAAPKATRAGMTKMQMKAEDR